MFGQIVQMINCSSGTPVTLSISHVDEQLLLGVHATLSESLLFTGLTDWELFREQLQKTKQSQSFGEFPCFDQVLQRL